MGIQLRIPFFEYENETHPELSYWSHRIIERKYNSAGDKSYGIYIVYYDMEGNFLKHDKHPIGELYHNVEALKADIEKLRGSIDREILTYIN